MRFRITKGLDIPIAGAPEQVVSEGPAATSVALLGRDYPGMRPAMRVEVGQRVKLGQPLFCDRGQPRIRFTSPGSGVVAAIEQGERRALLSVVVRLEDEAEAHYTAYRRDELAGLAREQVVETLLASGLWTAFRTRPYGKVPDPACAPRSIFVTAMDSNPLAAVAEVVIAAHRQDFLDGLKVIGQLTLGPIFLCKAPQADIPEGDPDKVKVAVFAGPHPAGLVGTHIHFLDPASAQRTIWHLGCQDVIAIGRLFTTGRLRPERIVALAGPLVRRPRLVRTRLGTSMDDLLRDELDDSHGRVVSGSVLSGHHAAGPLAFLGRYHSQVSVVAEGGQPAPEARKGPAIGLLASRLWRKTSNTPTTALHGRPTSMVLTSVFERVVPLDILPSPLLRALVVGDAEMAEALGCLELEEEDLALCSFLCPSKLEYGPLLRAILDRIAKEAR
jgi:Na+-transporting NADH:ubiquinone oxidoreductase subunit A